MTGALASGPGASPFVVLDDDPTGVQTLAGVRVLLAWDRVRVRAALEGRPAVHLITNSRALEASRARAVVEAAGRAALAGVSDARLVLRGDSTLRGHLLGEYLAVRDVVAPDRWPVLLLVPALPSAGRVTIGGVHLLERDGARVPVAETEFACDGSFAYTSTRLLDWAEERSEGHFRADLGRETLLDELRRVGGAAVARGLTALSAQGVPAVLAVDSETVDDLRLVADGYRAALDAGVDVIVRCAPAFAGALSGTTAATPASLPPADRVLVVCGSYVDQTTRQLERLLAARPEALVEADVRALAGREPAAEVERLAEQTSQRLADDGVAVLATPRARPDGTASLEAGERIARGLAGTVARIRPRPPVVVAKGGITAAVVLREGIGSDAADVLGPVAPGVSRWAARWSDGDPVDYLVVPGNVGDAELLARLVRALVRGSPTC